MSQLVEMNDQDEAKGHALCPNCSTPLQGPWCHACGQKNADYHRSIRHLAIEATEGLTEADGRLWGTVRRLMLAPARLTRDYLDGKRAPQVPPFRLFLIGVVILLLAGPIGNLGPNKTHIQFADPHAAHPQEIVVHTRRASEAAKAMANWLNTRMARAAKDPDRALAEMERWSHYAAILTILIAAPLLTLSFIRQKQFYFYDHLIFSMHSLAFQAVLLSTALILGGWTPLAWLLVLVAPVHLFVHMRGTYGTTIIGTLARMSFLLIGSMIGFAVLFVMLLFIGLAAET